LRELFERQGNINELLGSSITHCQVVGYPFGGRGVTVAKVELLALDLSDRLHHLDSPLPPHLIAPEYPVLEIGDEAIIRVVLEMVDLDFGYFLHADLMIGRGYDIRGPSATGLRKFLKIFCYSGSGRLC
jgi:hypothetical protein